MNVADKRADATRQGWESISEMAADAEARRHRGAGGAAAGLFPQVACRHLRPLDNFGRPEAVEAAGFVSAWTALKFITAERRRKHKTAAV